MQQATWCCFMYELDDAAHERQALAVCLAQQLTKECSHLFCQHLLSNCVASVLDLPNASSLPRQSHAAAAAAVVPCDAVGRGATLQLYVAIVG
jgi:hypothetical protein